MNLQWLNIIGLILTLAGAVALACGLIISRKQALRVGVSRLAGETDQSNLKLPHVRHEKRESRCALLGMFLLILGFLLQIIANWPR